MSSSSEADSLGSDVYRVERIMDSRIVANKIQYLIKWQGYPTSENTWEPEDNIIDPTVITTYWKDKEVRKKESHQTSFGAASHERIDSVEKKKMVTKNLTQLVSSMRKDHGDPVMEQKLDRKQDELRKRKAQQKEANVKKHLARATVDTDEEDDQRIWNRYKDRKSSSHPGPKAPPSPVAFRKQKKVEDRAERQVNVNKSDPVEKPKATVKEPEKPRTIKDVGVGTFFEPPPPTPIAPSQAVTGFDKGYKVKEIIGVSSRGIGKPRGLLILVKWEEVSGHDELEELVPMDILRVKEPAMLIAFLEARIKFHSDDEGDSVTESSDSDFSSEDGQEEGEYRNYPPPSPPQRPLSPGAH